MLPGERSDKPFLDRVMITAKSNGMAALEGSPMRHYLRLILPLLLAGCDAAQIEACRPGEGIMCGIVRPEDIELVTGTPWLMVSELGSGAKPGRILLIDPTTNERRILAEATPVVSESNMFPRCGEPPANLRPRGFHLSKGRDGVSHLLVVTGPRIERYRADIAEGNVTLIWEGCVDVPPTIMANDIAALPDEGFVVSHMYDPPRNFLLNFKMVMGLNIGYAVKWTPKDGWAKIPNTDVSFANGIQVDPATSRVYVSSMFTQRILGVDPDGANRIESARTLIQTDNLSWSDDGRLIGAGHTGFPVYGISVCRDGGDAPCSFPFAIVAFDPKTLQDQVLFQTPTGAIPGASVAVMKDNKLYLGTVFGDRITRLSFKN
jgi:sugar lactone lactonase YvrE